MAALHMKVSAAWLGHVTWQKNPKPPFNIWHSESESSGLILIQGAFARDKKKKEDKMWVFVFVKHLAVGCESAR